MDKKIKEKDMKVSELAVLMRDAFQSNQNYTDKKFNAIDGKFISLTGEMNTNFAEVKKQIDKININAVDVVRTEEFDKLEDRVTDVEEVLKLKLKKA